MNAKSLVAGLIAGACLALPVAAVADGGGSTVTPPKTPPGNNWLCIQPHSVQLIRAGETSQKFVYCQAVRPVQHR